MQLTNQQQKQLHGILVRAFPRREDLVIMVQYDLEKNLDEISSGENLNDTVFALLKWANAHDRFLDLIEAALESNPDNLELREFAAHIGEKPSPKPNNSPIASSRSWQARLDLIMLLTQTLKTTDQLLILCVVLDVRYDTLGGDHLESKIANLVQEMEQKQRIADLDAAARDLISRQEQEQERANNVVASLVAAASTKTSEISPQDQVQEITNIVNQTVQRSTARRLAGALVLWVDDRPDNNVYERRSMEPLGIRFVLSTSTEDALQKLKSNTFDAIISDMGRPPDPQAGYTLLDQIPRAGNSPPFIIYAGSNRPEHRALALRRGAYGSTNSPQELFQLVTSAILAG